MDRLTTENHTLKKKVTKRKFKLIKPDGTIVEKEFEESNTEETSRIVTSIKEEFTRKVEAIENKWKKIHTDRVRELKKKFDEELQKKETEVVERERIVEREKITKINEKKFRSEVGITTEKQLYLHVSYPIWGPVTVGSGVSGGGIFSDLGFGDARVGVGLEF